MLITTLDVKAENYEILGIVRGCRVNSVNVIKDVFSNLKNIKGGELTHYSDLLDATVEKAIAIMTENAKKMNADAIMGMRIATANITAGGAEIIAYGTAIRFIRNKSENN